MHLCPFCNRRTINLLDDDDDDDDDDPSGVGKSSTGLLARVKVGMWGAFTCVGWPVTLCDPIWQGRPIPVRLCM